MPPAQNGRGLLRIESVVDSTANNVEQFVCDGLLTTLVVLQIELAKEFVGIIRSCLHGHHASSMLRGHAVEKSRVEHQVGELRDELRENRVHVGLHDGSCRSAASQLPARGPRVAGHASSDTPGSPSWR